MLTGGLAPSRRQTLTSSNQRSARTVSRHRTENEELSVEFLQFVCRKGKGFSPDKLTRGFYKYTVNTCLAHHCLILSLNSPDFLMTRMCKNWLKKVFVYLLVSVPHHSGILLRNALRILFSYCQIAHVAMLQPEKAKANSVGLTSVLQLVGLCSTASSSSNLGPFLNSSFETFTGVVRAFCLNVLVPICSPNL